MEHDAWFGQDKALHFGVAAFLAAESSLCAELHGASDTRASVIGVSFVLGMGALKEVYDEHVKKTYWSWKDMFWNTVGGVVGGITAAKCSTANQR
jgi:putative lipoprotein